MGNKYPYIYTTENIEKRTCQISGREEHFEIGQLILWREDANSPHERSYFRVALTGSSGPATLALASIFVGEEQKEEFFEVKSSDAPSIDYKKTLLCELQERVRKIFMDNFIHKIEDMLYKKLEPEEKKVENEPKEKKEENHKRIVRYIELVKYATSSYLSTVLYRYFLPFLSERDINRIYYGMYTFVNSMKIDEESPFAVKANSKVDPSYSVVIDNDKVKKIVEEIPKVLLSLLERFRGIEAFYEVRVKHHVENVKADVNNEDTRKVIDIKMMDSNELYCFILPKKDEYGEKANDKNY